MLACRTVRCCFNIFCFIYIRQESIFIYTADTTGHAAVFAQRVFQDESRHTEIARLLRRIIHKIIMDLYKCTLAVIIICIDDCKRFFYHAFTGQDCLTCSPWLSTAFRHNHAFRNFGNLLERIADLHAQRFTDLRNAVADHRFKIFFQALSDDEYYFIKTSLDRVMDRVIHDDLAVRSDRIELLDSFSIAGTNTRCHNH